MRLLASRYDPRQGAETTASQGAPVGGLGGVDDAANNDKIDEATQALVAAEPLDEAGQVLDAVQARHREQDRLVLVLPMHNNTNLRV